MLFIIFLTQQLSGAYVVIIYANRIFQDFGDRFKYYAVILLGVIRFCTSLTTALCSRKFGRRKLFISSGIGMALSMFLSAMFIYLTSDTDGEMIKALEDKRWVLLILLLSYECSCALGFTVIPWTLSEELFPITVKGVMGGTMAAIAYFMMFGMTKNFGLITLTLGSMNTFFLFSGAALVGTAFIYVFLPETLGKSFWEIEKYFM